MRARILPLLLLIALAACEGGIGAEREVPYWASIRASELNMRVGPSQDYAVAWVYRRPGLPVKVLRVMEGWRLVQDPQGTQGWVVARLLSPERTAVVVGEGIAEVENRVGTLKWRVEPGVTGTLGQCEGERCEIAIGDREGWVDQSRLWGAGEP